MSSRPWYDTWKGALHYTLWTDRRLLIVAALTGVAQLFIQAGKAFL